MAQCVCGQYYNPGEAQCRYCGRMLEGQGYEYPAYDAPRQYQGQAYTAQQVQQAAKARGGQSQYAPQGYATNADAPQQGYAQADAPQGYVHADAPQASHNAPAPQPAQAPAQPAAAVVVAKPQKPDQSPEILAALRSIKRHSLIQTIAVIAGFVVLAVTSVWTLLILFALAEAFKK